MMLASKTCAASAVGCAPTTPRRPSRAGTAARAIPSASDGGASRGSSPSLRGSVLARVAAAESAAAQAEPPAVPFPVSAGVALPLGSTESVDGEFLNFATASRAARELTLCLYAYEVAGADAPAKRLRLLAEIELPGRTGDVWHCGLPAGEVEALLSESEALVYGFRARAELGSRAHCNARRVAAHAATGGEVLWLHDDCGDVSLADGSVCAALSAVPGFGADGMQIFGWEDNERPKDVGAHAEAAVYYELDVRSLPVGALESETSDAIAAIKATGATAVILGGMASPLLLHALTPAAATAGGVLWSSSPSACADGARAAVRALHAAGLAVLLDVRVASTCEDGDANAPGFAATDSPSYYRHSHGGNVEFGSGGAYSAGVYVGEFPAAIPAPAPAPPAAAAAPATPGSTAAPIAATPPQAAPPVSSGPAVPAVSLLELSDPMVQDAVVDGLRWLQRELHVDGFRVLDAWALASHPNGERIAFVPLSERIAHDPALAGARLLAQPSPHGWGDALSKVGGFPHWGRWSELNSEFAHAARRFFAGAGGDSAPRLCEGLRGSRSRLGSARFPHQGVNYVRLRDERTLIDVVAGRAAEDAFDGAASDATVPEPAMAQRQAKNLLLAMYIAWGAPLLAAGDELGLSRSGAAVAPPPASEPMDLSRAHMTDAGAISEHGASGGPEDLLAHVRVLADFRRRRADLLRTSAPRDATQRDKCGVGAGHRTHDYGGKPGNEKWAFGSEWAFAGDTEGSTCIVGQLAPSNGATRGGAFVALNGGPGAFTVSLPATSTPGRVWRRVADTAMPAAVASLRRDDVESGGTYELQGCAAALWEEEQ